MENNFKIIFVHGYTASSEADWYPALRPKLDALGIDYSIPDLPGDEHPKSDEWIEIIHKEVSKAEKPVVLVGHSLGTRAVLLYLEKYQTEVEKVLLISPLSNSRKNAKRRDGEAYPDFFEQKLDLEAIKSLVHEWLIIHSLDDYSLPYDEHGVALSNEMKVKLLTFSNHGHFTEPEDAPAVYKVLKKFVGF